MIERVEKRPAELKQGLPEGVEVHVSYDRSLLIITVSFLPVFTLEQQEGRLFAPLAYTKTFAMAAPAFLSITAIPVLMFYLVRGRIRPEADNPLSRVIIEAYRPIIRLVGAGRMVQFPGLTNAWTMPIKTRIDMLATGIKTPVGVKLLGDDLEILSEVGVEIEGVLSEIAGTASVYSERVVGGNYMNIRVRREDAARYGLNVIDVQHIVQSAIGGMNVTETVEGLERYPINVRFPRELRNDLATLRSIAVPTPLGHTVPLAQVADISIAKGPPAIKSENARRTAWIYVDLTTSDIGGYVARARKAVEQQVRLPAGVSIVWSGQYEYMERANRRLMLVVPLTLALIVILLYAHFRRLAQTGMVMLGTILFAPIGGIWLLYAFGFNLSVAVWVGFIALLGLAAETGIVMLVYLDQAYERFRREGRMRTLEDLKGAIVAGTVDRVRPKLMTVSTTMVGLLPIMVGTETGTRVMKRIAAPMVGGLISSTLLTLIVLPVIYLLWRRLSLQRD